MIAEAPERTTPSSVGLCPRVFVCDPSEIARLGITLALRPLGVEVVATADGSPGGLDVLDDERIDLMLIDVNLPDSEEMIRQAVDRRVIVIGIGVEAGHERPFAALIAGAVGYLTKDLPASEWADGIKAAMRGEAPLSRSMTARLVEAYRRSRSSSDLVRIAPSNSRLTSREWEILTRVSEGKTNRAVAAELFISVETVRTHVSSILSKLQAPNRSAAAAKYHELVRAG
jgi:two-component system, NarL family, response regulator LiaR